MDESLARLCEEGFELGASITALNRCNGNYLKARELLCNDLDFDEFDLLAQAPPEPAVKPKSQTHHARSSHSEEKIDSNLAAELLDGRITSLKEMGFTEEDSEWALSQCGDDVNAALNLLLQEKSSS